MNRAGILSVKTAKKRRLFGGIFAHFLRGFQGKKSPKNAYAFYEKRIEVYIFWVAHYKGRVLYLV